MEKVFSSDIRTGTVLVDGVKVETIAKEIDSANIIDVEVGTTGYCGGDSGHGGRTYFRIKNVSGTDMSVRINKSVEYDWMSNLQEIELMFGGDCELDTFIEALEFAIDTIKQRLISAPMTPQEKKQDDFRHYLSDLVALYRKTGKLNGMSDCKKNYHCSGITKIQFFEVGLHEAAKDNVELLDAAFCKQVYEFVLGKANAPRYNK